MFVSSAWMTKFQPEKLLQIGTGIGYDYSIKANKINWEVSVRMNKKFDIFLLNEENLKKLKNGEPFE